MKVLVTGAGGQLGFDVVNELKKRGDIPIASDIVDCDFGDVEFVKTDITKSDEVEKIIAKIKPDTVVHCAAWTAVDAAEDEENKDKVFAINVKGTQNIACSCKNHNCKMVYISTDYVFNGQGNEPWQPDCKEFEPQNFYGKTKLLGEQAVSEVLEKFFIIRIAWVFGKNGNNFVDTMLKIGKKYDKIRVVNDQIGTPTYTYDLAKLICDMIKTKKYGFYHSTNEGGYISWYDFAVEIFKQANYKTVVIPVSSAEYGISKAKRPFNSRLNKEKLTEKGFYRLPDWKDALNRYLEVLNNDGENT